MKPSRFGWIVLFVAVPMSSLAQTNQNDAPVKDWSNETVIVTAQPPGPAFWRVSKDKSEVWILGMVEPIPRDLKWDTRGLEKLVGHARAVLLPPRGQVGLFEGLWFLITSGDVLRLPDDQKLEVVLPEPLKGRVARALIETHRDWARYSEYKASVAGFMLEGDFLRSNNLVVDEPVGTIRLLAARRSVPVHTIATYPALDIVKEVSSLSPEGHRKCLEDSLDDIDIMHMHAKSAADAWAIGDLEGIKAHYFEPNALDCLGRSASFTQMWLQSVADSVTAIDGALERPGTTVVIIDIGELLRKNGVLKRLAAQGFQIEGPAMENQ